MVQSQASVQEIKEEDVMALLSENSDNKISQPKEKKGFHF